ncbi:phosphotransferase [Janibacter limosus]|uniref:phosphotransferase n=1 Tax=Janibacter limosus TaxID=53458 RepID=UPI0035D94F1A
MTSRGPLALAAPASAAVEGLDPSSVEGVVGSGPSRSFEVAFVRDHEHRRWVIRCPRTPAASARLEQSAALPALLARRLTMPVPVVKGWVALPEGGRAAVHAYLTGRAIDLASIAPGLPPAVGLGRALAHLHNLDRRVYEEAGVPVYEAEAYRTRRPAELDRAAATGRVPTGLLTRWEHTLEDVSLWRFTTTPTHGGIGSSTIPATPDDGEDPDVKSLLGWESARVADPADDLAALVGELHPDSLDTVLEAYAHARSDRPDQHLQERARLVHQMQLVRTMMSAVAAGDDDGAEEHARQLRRLDDQLAREDEGRAAAAKPVVRPAAPAASSDTPPEAGAEADEAASSDTDAAGRSQNDTPAGADHTAGREGHTAAGQDQTVAGDGDDEAAVEVETTGAPTPVEVPASNTSHAAPKDSDAGPASASGDTMTRASDSATTDLTSSSDGSPTTDTAPVPHLVRDHETAEIVPLTGDEGDDVLPPSPRR